jgi:DNA-binding response OmpR family regulator
MQNKALSFPKRVLVAEDQALIGFLMQAELSDAGFQVVGPFRSCAAASKWLTGDTPDEAILDVELSDGACTQVAAVLKQRGVRFVVFSGSMSTYSPEVFSDALWFQKPSDFGEVIAALKAG